MNKKDMVRLDRILGLLGSDQAGERAAAALAATRLVQKHGLTWWEILEGRALGPRAAAAIRRSDPEAEKAAQSRLRQLKRHNEALEKQVQRLKEQLGAQPQRRAPRT